MKYIIILAGALVLACTHTNHHSTDVAKGVAFANIKDGDTIKRKSKVQFSVTGMELKPAGDPTPNSGHHHLIIDGNAFPAGTMVPKDDKNLHYGAAQAEAEISLKPGKHTLTLQFADKDHKSFGEEWSKTIAVDVK